MPGVDLRNEKLHHKKYLANNKNILEISGVASWWDIQVAKGSRL